MTNPRLRRLIITGGGLVLALFCGYWIAEESFFWPALALCACTAVLLAWLRCGLCAVVMAGTLFGYIVGNRGFAQAMPFNGLPLFAAELALALTLGAMAFQSAVHKVSPVRRDALNLLVLAWLVLGAARLCIDLPRYGIFALRDSAMVYYALFFFIGQSVAADPSGRRWLQGALTAALALLPPLFLAYDLAPEWFYGHLLFRGVPLILYKGDIAATVMAGGVFYFYWRVCAGWRLAWAGVLASFAGAIYPLTRAALVAFALAALLHVLALRGRMLLVLGCSLALSFVGSAAWSLARGTPFEESHAYQIGEYALTVFNVDPGGLLAEPPEGADVKGNPLDNNEFRRVWWWTVAEETLENNPGFGSGFGDDLAARFISEYGLSGDLDFSARSPHSIVLSTFGRLGFAGLSVLLGLLGAMIVASCRAAALWRRDRSAGEPVALWAMAWTIFLSACFGVVLEGPMGAVVFWTVLGMAAEAGRRVAAAPAADPGAEKSGASPAKSLQVAGTSALVSGT